VSVGKEEARFLEHARQGNQADNTPTIKIHTCHDALQLVLPAHVDYHCAHEQRANLIPPDDSHGWQMRHFLDCNLTCSAQQGIQDNKRIDVGC